MNEHAASAPRPRYIMIGGFLGAGKTTAVLKLAQWLTDRGRKVGLISNDQGSRLVDTALFQSGQFPTEEIAGGCFCCRFNSLVEAAARLHAASRPDVFIAEPVGSCTDLVATVTYPLRQLYGADYTIAPLSVLVDPIRVARILGLEDGPKFSDKVVYIYCKQLEEADLLVINKTDLVLPEKVTAIHATLRSLFPKAHVLPVSSRLGDGLEDWFARLTTTEQQARAVMSVDYDVYAEGEALLGWLNGTLRLKAGAGADANLLLETFAREIQARLQPSGIEIAHLKMALDPGSPTGDLAAINLVRSDVVPELSLRLEEAFETAELTINLRAEAAPERLRDAVQQAARQTQAALHVTGDWQRLEAFKPGKPQPTHRAT